MLCLLGLGLTHSLQPHAPLPQRALGSLPGVNYAAAHHPALHSSAMSQIMESMSPLTGGFNAQSFHKGMGLSQNLVFESVRADQQSQASSARFSAASSAVFSPSKSSLFAEEHAIKEPPHAYSSPSVISQSPALDSSKGWGLSNFMPPPTSNPFGSISSMDLSNALPICSASHRSSQPPPAHSSASRHNAIQRNPFSPDGLLGDTSQRSVRADLTPPSSSSPQIHSLYGMMQLGRQHSHSTPTPISQAQLDFHGIPSHSEIEDLSSGSQPHLYYSMASTTYSSSTPTNTSSFAASQLTNADINYDPVSPATPLSDNQHGETAFPTTVSFADLNAIGASASHPTHGGGSKSRNSSSSVHGGPPGLSLADPKDVPSHLHSLMMPQPSSRRHSSKSQQQMSGSVNSPHQHSPISVGSPQAPMSSIGSPQNVMPSSTVKPSAPPIQAMADSSTAATKPKKQRSRKKPKGEILKTVPPPPSSFGGNSTPAFLSSSQGFSSGSNNQSYQQPQTPRSMPQFQPPDNQTLMQTQFGGSGSSPSPQTLMRMRGSGSLGDSMSSDSSRYQVMSSIGNQQVSPMSDQSPRSQQQGVETPSLMPLSNSSMSGDRSVSGSPLKGLSGSSANEPMMSGNYQEEPELMTQTGGQFDLQAFSSQPYMEQLVSAQPPAHIRLVPSNVYSEAVHLAAGMPVFPAPYTTYQRAAEGSSTIDEAAFSSLFDTSSSTKESQVVGIVENNIVELEPPQPVPVPKPSATCTNPIDEDDELCNFAKPPPEMDNADKERTLMSSTNSLSISSGGNSNSSEQAQSLKFNRPSVKQAPGFQDSFLNFLMGKKQETLSSVTSATIGEKPQLPKYIPEPRRPPPPVREPVLSQDFPVPQSPPPISFSDDDVDDNSSNVGTAVKTALSNLGEESEESEDSDVPEAPGYSVQRTKDLTVKITLQNTLKRQNKSRGRPRGRGGGVSRGRGSDSVTKIKFGAREPTPPPPRESIGRRAKDMAKEKASKKKSKFLFVFKLSIFTHCVLC